MAVKYLPLILIGVVLNAFAQLVLKKAMVSVGVFSFQSNELVRALSAAAFNPYLLIGLASYLLSFVVWMLVLSRVDVGVAYPCLSIGYVLALLGSWAFLGEPLSMGRALGIALIIAGVVVVTRS